MDNKAILRSGMLEKRSKLKTENKKQLDEDICRQLWALILEKDAKVVHSFIPMGDEINLFPLLKKLLDSGIVVVSPKTKKRPILEHYPLKGLDQLEEGVFGTKYPTGDKEFERKYDVIIVPALAFDKDKNRVGYGGGFYDYFLKDQPDAWKVGIGYPFQLIEKLDVMDYDVPVDQIIIPK